MEKRVLHLNGGKTVDEINTFKNSLSTLSPLITKGTVGGTVKAFVKQSLIEVESVNIAPEVNEGVGMISYIGHGAQTLTDFDFGYVSAVNRGYENPSKYPLMYFNGCGVGNIFNARLNSNINASDKMPLSLDWMLSKQKGAIAVIANSFDSYLAPTVHYLDELYSVLFADSTAEKLPIGKIQQRIAKNILMGNNNSYDIANVHQSLLQGDPALHLIRVPYPDYSLDPDQSISLYSESANTSIGNSKTLKIAIKISNWGRYIKQQEIPVEIKYYYKNGTSQVVNELVNAIAYEDTIFVKYDGIGQNLQRINVKIDPDAKLTELNTNNNVSELIIDWDIASAEIIYPAQNVKDIVPPLLNVMFNGRFIANEEIIFPNPIITFTLQDDRLIQLDTSLISIYIKPCGDESCDYKRLILNNNDLIKIRAISDHSIEVVYHPEDIQGGIYEMLVSTHDMSGNSESNSYSIRFIVANDVVNKAVQVVCSPNPSSDYVKFEIKDVELSSFTSVQWAIYDPNGLLLENRSIEPSQLFGRTWYWIPQVKSGVYIYKIHLNDKSNKLYEVTGKVIVVN
nr:C25 family cysteine peptidase [Dyadobacter sp. NIV53]